MAAGIKKKTPDVGTELARIYLFLNLLGLPLVIRDGYFDITETKTLFFAGTTLLFLLGRAVLAIQSGEKLRRPGAAEWAALIFGAVTLAASLMTGRFADSFFGRQGRWQGAGMQLLYVGLFFALRDRPLRRRDVLLPMGLSLALSGALALVHHLGGDPFGWQGSLIEFDRGRYISTLGNINFAGAYFSMTTGIFLMALLSAETNRERILFALPALLGVWGAMASRSESAVLGLSAGLILSPLFCRDASPALRRWPLLGPGLALGMQLYGRFILVRGGELSELTLLLLHPAVCAALILAGLGLWLLVRRLDERGMRTARRLYGFLLLGGFLLGVLALTLLNTLWRDVPLGAMEGWLRFSPSWGTDRGKIWSYCLGLYRRFPLPEKLLGGGCGVLSLLDARYRIFPDAILDAAHNEYLQLLLNWGALGLFSFLCWLVLAAGEAFRRRTPLAALLLAGLAAYAVQAAVNIAQTPTVALFFLLLAALRAADAGPAAARSKKRGFFR